MDFLVQDIGPVQKRIFQLTEVLEKSMLLFALFMGISFISHKLSIALGLIFILSIFYRKFILYKISKELVKNGFNFIKNDSSRVFKGERVFNFSFNYNHSNLKFSLIENISEKYLPFSPLDKKLIDSEKTTLKIKLLKIFAISSAVVFVLIPLSKMILPLNIAPYAKAVIFLMWIVGSVELFNQYLKSMKKNGIVLKKHNFSLPKESVAEYKGILYHFENTSNGVILVKKVN